MKLLISISETQGRLKNDFNYTEPDKPLFIGSQCNRGTWDHACGCRRSLCGIYFAQGTTTFKVVDFDFEEFEAYVEAVTEHYVKCWSQPEAEARLCALEQVFDVNEIANRFPVGTVLERREDAGGIFER
jgi:hypothetical protein